MSEKTFRWIDGLGDEEEAGREAEQIAASWGRADYESAEKESRLLGEKLAEFDRMERGVMEKVLRFLPENRRKEEEVRAIRKRVDDLREEMKGLINKANDDAIIKEKAVEEMRVSAEQGILSISTYASALVEYLGMSKSAAREIELDMYRKRRAEEDQRLEDIKSSITVPTNGFDVETKKTSDESDQSDIEDGGVAYEAGDDLEGTDTSYREKRAINGVEMSVGFDPSYHDYTIIFPQIKPGGEEARRREIFDSIIRISEDPKFAKRVFDYAARLAEDITDPYDVYKKTEEFINAEGL